MLKNKKNNNAKMKKMSLCFDSNQCYFVFSVSINSFICFEMYFTMGT